MTAIDGLPKLAEVIETYGLAAKRSLGQNFLLDLNLTSRIAREAGDISQCDVVEIGPGPGGLTRALLANGARRVIAIERDERCLPALEEISKHYPDRLTIVHGDALEVDIPSMVEGPAKLVANLPYNIATPLLTGWLLGDAWPPYYTSLTLMFQKEVAERICARPGEKAYGRLGVLCGWRSHAQIAFDVSPQAFTPPPKVTSSIVNLIPKAEPEPCEASKLEAITRAAFGQRRKMLRSSLKALGGQALLEKAGIDGQLRAEQLSVNKFAALAREI